MRKALRRKILRRDRRTCQLCGKKGAGQIHHLIPKSKGGKDTENNLVLLCGPCHLLISPIPLKILKRILKIPETEIRRRQKKVKKGLARLKRRLVN
ncbi:MAG: HNH endonuclease [candidate division WOR-3 bacterium]